MVPWTNFFETAFGEIFFLFLCISPIPFIWQTVFADTYTTNTQKLCVWLLCLYAVGLCSFTGITTILYRNFSFYPDWHFALLGDVFVSPKQYIFNIMLFMPLGFLLPLMWKPFHSQNKILLTGFLCSFAIEFLQMFCGRMTDVDDLLTNTVGAVLGYWLFVFVEQKTIFYQLDNQLSG